MKIPPSSIVCSIVLFAFVIGINVVTARAQGGVPVGGCKIWQDGKWVQVPCSDGSSGSGSGSSSGAGNTGAGPVSWLACKLFGGAGCPAKIDKREAAAYELNEKGLAAYNKGDWATAVSYFEEALKKSPDDPVIKKNVANARAWLASIEAKEKTEREAAEAKRKDKAAADNMQQAIQNFAKTLNAAPSSGQLDFDGRTAGSDDNGGLDFTVAVATPSAPLTGFYALQTRTLTPMADGGHPIDAPGSPPVGLHGLVGGTTWTFGFQRLHVKCDQDCQADMKRNLDGQLTLFCSSQSDPNACLKRGLPFTPDMYDLVVSMGSSHAAIEDLATRVLFDGATFGEFSRQNKEMFASLKGRGFDTLDCHSNGALICLAALRSGDTTAKEVRLFGPQMTPEAAKRWQEYAANTNTTIKIYLNYGDPVAAISWKQPTPQTPLDRAATAAWLFNPVTGPPTLADALFSAYFDSRTDVMGPIFRNYGFHVTRSKCKDSPSIDCHSMKLYEMQLHEKDAESIPK